MLQPAKTARRRRSPLSTRRMVSPSASQFYGDTIRTLTDARIPFVVGGAFALKHYAGVARGTKDLDIFLRRQDLTRALDALDAHGYMTDQTFPHWLAKAWCGEQFVDFIFASANGLCSVDDQWFSAGVTVTIFGQPALLCPIEEVIWSKCFVMERERFDGADIHHLIAAKGSAIDWARLLGRVGENWRVLLAHLIVYGFVYPREREQVPAWVLNELTARLAAQRASEDVPVCNGTLLSREQYLFDLEERGYADARLPPFGNVSSAEIALWTDAIGKAK
jgi:hypothetical protein